MSNKSISSGMSQAKPLTSDGILGCKVDQVELGGSISHLPQLLVSPRPPSALGRSARPAASVVQIHGWTVFSSSSKKFLERGCRNNRGLWNAWGVFGWIPFTCSEIKFSTNSICRLRATAFFGEIFYSY